MFKQDHPLQSSTPDAVTENELQHVLIPACELGIERYQEFRAANPHWRPRSYVHAPGDESSSFCEGCRICVSTSKPSNAKPQLTVECVGLSKVVKPISISFSKPNHHTRMPMAENMASFHAIQSPVVIKATQQYANKGAVLEETAMSKPPLVKSAGREGPLSEHAEEIMKSNSGEDHSEHADQSERMKGVQPTVSEHATSSEELSDNTAPSQMEAMSLSDHAVGASQGDKVSKYTGTVRVDEPILVDDEDLFNYVLATRQIPYGHSYSNLDISMQRRLHDYFKQSCPPCPHCNCNTYVKFRYFNNSGKSSLLQPRFSCRNPDTCLTIQEKSGKAGSRDFTLPKPKEGESNKASAIFSTHERATGLRGRAVRQPQMIPLSGSKRPAAHNLTSLAEAGERSAKLPNTTLSLQTLNGPQEVGSLQVVETATKVRALQSGKHAEDSNSSSSTRRASDEQSDEQTEINVRCRAEASSENGRLVVQPISVQKVVSTSGKAETKRGKDCGV